MVAEAASGGPARSAMPADELGSVDPPVATLLRRLAVLTTPRPPLPLFVRGRDRIPPPAVGRLHDAPGGRDSPWPISRWVRGAAAAVRRVRPVATVWVHWRDVVSHIPPTII